MSDDMIKRLQESRANEWESMKGFLDERGTDLSAEDRESYDKRSAALDLLDERIEDLTAKAERGAALDKRNAELSALPQTRQTEQSADKALEQQLRTFLKMPVGSGFDWMPGADESRAAHAAMESRTLSKGTAAAGGNTVPTSFYNQMVDYLYDASTLLQLGPTILRTNSGENLDIPTVTGRSAAALVAEGAQLATSEPTFGKVTLSAYKAGGVIKVPSELIDDTGVDLLGFVAKQAGQALAEKIGAWGIVGTGSSQPQGVVTAASAGVTGGAGVTGAFTADNIIDLEYSVNGAYANNGKWLMNRSSLGKMRKLKDSQGQYLWQPSLIVGAPTTFDGAPVYTDPNVAATALSAKSVLFGDFSSFWVRLVNGFRFERSNEFGFDTDVVTFRFIARMDSKQVDQTGAIKAFVGNAA